MPWLLFLPSLERIAAVAITTKVQDGATLILVGLQPLLLNSPLILAAVGLLLGDQLVISRGKSLPDSRRLETCSPDPEISDEIAIV